MIYPDNIVNIGKTSDVCCKSSKPPPCISSVLAVRCPLVITIKVSYLHYTTLQMSGREAVSRIGFSLVLAYQHEDLHQSSYDASMLLSYSTTRLQTCADTRPTLDDVQQEWKTNSQISTSVLGYS